MLNPDNNPGVFRYVKDRSPGRFQGVRIGIFEIGNYHGFTRSLPKYLRRFK
jgi:hypothetical protein